MARHLPEPSRPLRWQILVFPLLMGTVAWAAFREANPVISTLPPTPSANIEASSTSTRILLGRKAPNQDRDEAFVYDEVQNTIVATSTSAGWRIPDEKVGRISARSENGVWAFESAGWESVTLRTSRGNPYLDPILIGEMDRDHAVIQAINSDRAVLIVVARNGSIQELATLAEGARPLTIQEGRVWISQSAPQEGIETPPQGPSSVWSIDIRGVTSTAIVDERTDTVISNVVEQKPNAVFVSEKGDMRAFRAGRLGSAIVGKPLAWLPDQRLLFVQNNRLCFLSSTDSVTCSLDAPAGIVWAQFLTP